MDYIGFGEILLFLLIILPIFLIFICLPIAIIIRLLRRPKNDN